MFTDGATAVGYSKPSQDVDDPVAALYAKANKKNGELDSFDMSSLLLHLLYM
jgi:hypothetical protein